jgi:diaminopimelate epimerase
VTLQLTKHHGLGNDFLVLFADHTNSAALCDPVRLAQRLCDRRRGIGADGLLIGSQPDASSSAAAVMVLYNADGSRAEMSGNGIRCFAQALLGRGATSPMTIATDAGERVVTIEEQPAGDVVMASVSMGAVADADAPDGWDAVGCDPMRPVLHLSLGNPHTVVGVEDVAAVNLASLGQMVPQVNLEIVEPGPEPDAITMRVHERGAGITEACGTGACASAFAARSWGLIPAAVREITVHMSGGDATVRLDQPAPGEVTLVGPATQVGVISVTVPQQI